MATEKTDPLWPFGVLPKRLRPKQPKGPPPHIPAAPFMED